MDISHWKCRALQFFDFKETVKAFFTQKRRFYLKPDVFVWTVGSLEEFGHYRTIGEIC